jgi:ADP-heptose:LPS heptosyltransferase
VNNEINIRMKNNDINNFYRKPLTTMELYSLGISIDNFQTVETLDELRNNPTNIIVAECKTGVMFTQNHSRPQKLIKKENYVMNAGVYGQLHYEPQSKQEILKPSAIQFKKIYKPYLGQDLTNKTLLVFRQGGIGDLLFIKPNLDYLKEKYPDCTIKIACGPQYQPMVQEWECIDEMIDLPFTVSQIFRSDYQLVFEGVIERCKEAENTCSYHLFSKWMGLDIPDQLLIPKQKPNTKSLENSLKILEEMNIKPKDFIIIQMRASSLIRTPDKTVWKKLVLRLIENQHKILFTDSPKKSGDIDLFIESLNLSDENKKNVKNYSTYSKLISDTIAMASLAKLAIATDSSLIHIAESVGTKSFAIMGPFPGNIRLSTYKNNDWIDAPSKSNCSPCFIHSQKPCPNSSLEGDSLCYRNLDYDLCIEKIERLLNK